MGSDRRKGDLEEMSFILNEEKASTAALFMATAAVAMKRGVHLDFLRS